MPVVILRSPATQVQLDEMITEWGVLIKVVVDVRREFIAGGGEMHADCESVLLTDGSQQEDLWGGDWYPDSREIRFEALVNIRPRHGNMRLEVQNEATRAKMELIMRHLLEGKS
jgi:hypothetical protein